VTDDPHGARAQLDALTTTLNTVARHDPDREVQGVVVPVLDDAIDGISAARGESAVPRSIWNLVKFRPNESMRAADALVLVGQLSDSLGPAE
jgi:hypothetical protein